MEHLVGNESNKSERRNALRMPYRAPVHCENASVNGAGTVRDISSDGMFLETLLPFNDGDHISIGFRLRNSKHPMNIKGKVTRSAYAGFGVRFIWS